MNLESDPLPPVPIQTAPILEDNIGQKKFHPAWLGWFVHLKEKVDVINASIRNLASIVAGGFVAKDAAGNWSARTITGTPGRVTVSNGDGISGNPAIDVVTSGFITDAITDGVVDKAPSQNAVFDALALRALIPKGYIDGLQLQWVSGTALTVSSGAAYIEASGNIVLVNSAIAKTALTLSVSTWYHVYLYLNAGIPDIEIVTAAPVIYNGTARSKTGDTSRRYVGSIKTDAAGAIYSFVASPRGTVNYNVPSSNAPFRLVSNGTATTITSVSAAAVIPVTSRQALMRVSNNGTAVLSLGHPADGNTAYPLIVTIAASAVLGSLYLTDDAQAFTYINSSAGGPGGIVADLFGYTYER